MSKLPCSPRPWGPLIRGRCPERGGEGSARLGRPEGSLQEAACKAAVGQGGGLELPAAVPPRPRRVARLQLF